MRRTSLLGGRRERRPPTSETAASDVTRAAYMDIPYPGLAFPQSHPDRLATHAQLLGMKPAPPERCRVLELGCGDGGQLVPMAALLPGSEFVGVDIAPSAIAAARARAQALGAANVDFVEADLATIDPARLGQFDYVLAHGVFSWVPRELAGRVLAVCRAVLARQGVAYVSYNALPGGDLRAPARTAMRFHGRGLERSRDRLDAAREMLAALASMPPGEDLYREFAAAHAHRLSERDDALLFHDDLEADNRALLFSDFVAEAGAHRLQYLAEADWFEMSPKGLPKAAAVLLDRCGEDRIAREQYLDFLTSRAYRQTLICRDEVRVAREPQVEATAGLHAAARIEPASQRADPRGRSKLAFRSAKGATLTTDHPMLKASLIALGAAWPRRLDMGSLLEAAANRLGLSATAADERALADLWLRGYDANVIQLHSLASTSASRPGERPIAAEVARRQLAYGEDTVTTLGHESVRLDASTRRLLELLDGTRDREALAHEMEAGLASAQTSKDARRLRRELDENLDRLAALSLLQG